MAVRALVEKKMKTFIPGTEFEGVIAELKKSGFIVAEAKKRVTKGSANATAAAEAALKLPQDGGAGAQGDA